MLISFYPGPSKIYPEVASYMQEAVGEGILSLNHRSEEFMHLCEKTIQVCKKKLNIPADYTLFFASSATECWEIIAQSCLRDEDKVFHYYQGAFGQKWADYTKKLCAYRQGQASISCLEYDMNTPIDACELVKTPVRQADWVCVVGNGNI